MQTAQKPVFSRFHTVALAAEAWFFRQRPAVRWALVVVWYGLIFLLSALPAASSRRTKNMVGGDDVLNMLVRMAAHAAVFAVLASLLYLALNRNFATNPRRFVVTHLLNLLGGVGDELHQTFVPGRFFRVQDILTDVVGGLLAVWLLLWYFRLLRSEADERFQHSK